MNVLIIIILTILWLTYFLIHSVLASNEFKAVIRSRFSQFYYAYRIIYNITAVVLLLPIFYIIHFESSNNLIHWSGALAYFGNGLALIAIGGFAYSLKFYGGMDFMGITQFKAKHVSENDAFVISPLHRFVRHPWYFFALIIIWTRDMNVYFLLSAVLMTAYFFIGSRFEEKKLVEQYGEPYEKYLALVPGIIPSFSKRLSKSQADKLQD